MAIALNRTQKRPRPDRTEWRGVAAVVAFAVILVGIALSGGLQLPDPATRLEAPAAAGAGSEKPVLDNRGKWTGYTE
ncbi:MAG TPA: hypothetical protein VFZ01_14420 [Geminicoccaceae bacterium]